MDPFWVAILTAIGVASAARPYVKILQPASAVRRRDALAWTIALALATSLPAAADDAPRARCLQDALEQWFCASDPKGVAVIGNLGTVACAAGGCIQVEDEWQCSATSGGKAELTPEGPACEGGCRSPRAAECERM